MADEELEDEYVRKPSKLPLIGGIVGALLLGLGGGFGVAMALAGGGDAATQVDGEAAGAGESLTERVIVTLGQMRVNLRGIGGASALQLEVQVEVSEASQALITQRIPVLKDAVITLASDYTYTDLEGLDGKTRLRDELLARLNTVLDEGHIERVYFTEFMVE